MINEIKKLRQQTGAPLEQIRLALQASRGDPTKAAKLLTEFGKQTAAKRAAKTASAGVVASYSHLGKVGVIVELNCETDFVGRNEQFHNFAHELALQIAAQDPKDAVELLKQTYIKDESKTVADLLAELSGKLGEKVVIGRFSRIELGQ